MSTTTNAVRSAAIAAYRAGYNIMPAREDGSKAPAVTEWAPYQTERIPREQMRAWFSRDRAGLILICGFNNVEALDFDTPEIYQAFRDTAEASGLDALVARIEAGYLERTPGGYHWIYRCSDVGRNTALARCQSVELDTRGKPKIKSLIETRGRGGYVVIAPSHGQVHDEGGAYELLSGGFDRIAEITPAERAALLELASAFDELPKVEYSGRNSGHDTDKTRPGDDYNSRGPAWQEILQGWTLVYRRGQVEYWRRPGKDRGISATINAPGVGPDRLYVFSTSTEFEAGRSYSKFQAYAVLQHDGDFSAAAASLAHQGYGAERDHAQFIFTNGQRHEPVGGTKRTDYPLTDTGNAERLVDQFGEHIRFVVEHDRWIVYDGKRWAPDQTRQLERMAKAVARDLHNEADEIADEKHQRTVKTWARRSESTAGKRNMIISAQAEPGIVLDHNLLDAQPHYLNTQSGTVNLKTGTVQPFRRLDYLSKITNAGYDSRAECPTWDAFLERIFDGDRALIAYIQRAVGYSFTGETSEQVMFIMWGDGANGKSTFLNALMSIAGPYGRNTPAETLYERRQDAIPNDLAALQGARFVGASETDDRRTLSEGRIKQMTGGDRISARFMRAEWFEFTPQFKVWLATNHKPEIKGTDHAIWRRLRLIPFTVRIPEEERDKELTKKLEREASGILRWIVEGAQTWYRTGLEPTPEAVLTATEDYQEESDYVGMWLNERCELLPDAQTRVSHLYEDFVDWSRRHGRSPGSQTRFGRELNAREGLAKRKSNGVMVIAGVRFKPPTTFET